MFKASKRQAGILGAIEAGILPGPGQLVVSNLDRAAMFQMSETLEMVLEKKRVMVP